MLQILTRPAAWLCGLLVIVALLLSPTTEFSARAATNDTPVPFVQDAGIEEWAVGAGLVYWANNCFADEFNPIAELRRKPASGGAVKLIKAINTETQPDATCSTFRNMVSTGQGLFYAEDTSTPLVQRIMRMPLSEPYNPQVVKLLTAEQSPTTNRAFVEAGDYLYWPVAFTNKIFRVRKDGSGEVETVAETNPNPTDLIVVGNTVYWTDSVGVFGKSIACDELPCDGQEKFDDFPNGALAYGLVYKPVSGNLPFQNGFRLYWVERTGTSPNFNYKIQYRACNFLTPCFLEVAPDPPNPTPEPPPPTLFYAASVNRVIGDLVLVNDNIFWTENGGGANGDVFRKPYNAPADQAPANLATNQGGIDQELYVVGNNLYFARSGMGGGIFTLPLDATPITRDFQLEAFEVTQGIQNLANDVPLVAKKTTYVRAYGKQIAGPSTSNVEAHLIARRGGVQLPGSPLKPVNGVRGLVTGSNYDRASLNNSWYFLLPENWITQGTVQFELEIDPRHLHTDPNPDNNRLTKEITFQNQPPVCVMTVPVRTHNPIPSVYDPNVGIMVSNFERRWPVPAAWIYRDTEPVEELEICTWYGIPYPCYGPYELSDGWGITNGIPDRDKVIVSLWTRAMLSFNPDACDDIGAPVHFMGMVHPDADNGGAAGYASTISNQSWVQLPGHGPISSAWNAMREGDTMAQELAHNHGRKHVNCGGPDNIDNNYPYPPCQIGPNDATAYFGFDIASRQPIRPTAAKDFMSYGSPRWVSDYTWRALLGKFAATSAAAVGPLAPAQGETVFVTGMVDGENARGEITLVLILPAETLPPATRQQHVVSMAGVMHGDEPHITYSLRLFDPSNTVIADRPLTLLPLDDHTPESEAFIFSDLFAKPQQQVAKIQLVADSTPVYTITPGLSEPVVSVQQPAAGVVVEDEMTIQWTASDPDPADRLKFTVQYSHDNGASWHTLAINVPSTPEGSYTLALSDLGSLHGSAPNAARIRVLASDGYNTKIALSQGFTVPNRPPQPWITSPASGQILPGGEAVVLQGSATDPEDGGLDASSLHWRVDGVAVGTGAALAVNGLASASHTAELSATDSNSQTVTATVSFEIAPLQVPLTGTAPLLDGSCSDASYTASTIVPLSAYSETAEATVYLLRSDDYLWVCFSDLQLGAAAPVSYVGLRADINNSRDPQVQTSDAGFFVSEDGDVFTQAGNGAGDFAAPGPDGLEGQVAIGGSSWSAELRIEKEALGGWDHLINLALGHHDVNAADDDYAWPFRSQWAQPNTWSAAALGNQPLITLVDPSSASVISPTFTLTIEGSGFVSGTQVLWDDSELPTTFVDSEHLTAQVANTLLGTAGTVQISARAPGGILSNEVPFVIKGAAPAISGLSPANTKAGSNAFTLTVNGSNFTPDAKVLWNGTPLVTQFVSPTQLRAQVDAALLETGKTAGISVENPTPTAQISAITPFQVLPTMRSFMPGLYNQK